MKKYWSIIFSLAIIGLATSCKKEKEPDYREKFTGNFSYVTITRAHYIDGRPDEIDTTTSDGQVSKDSDNANNLAFQLTNSDRITGQVNKDGVLPEQSNQGYIIEGHFTGTSEVILSIAVPSSVSGHGRTVHLDVSGKRK